MTRKSKREEVTAMIWILLGAAITIWSATFPFGNKKAPGPGFLPLILGLILLGLGIFLLFQTSKQKKENPVSRPPFLPPGASLSRVILTVVGMVVSTALLEHLGFFLTIFCLLFFLRHAMEPQKLRGSAVYAMICAFGSLVIFRFLLKTPLPGGLLGF